MIDIAVAAFTIAVLVAALAAARPRREPIPPVSRRAMQRLLEHRDSASDPDGTG